jgi:DUF438 domain-containing protein
MKFLINIERTAQQMVTVEAESVEDAKLQVEHMSSHDLDKMYKNYPRSVNFTDYHEVMNDSEQYTGNHADLHRTGTHTPGRQNRK